MQKRALSLSQNKRLAFSLVILFFLLLAAAWFASSIGILPVYVSAACSILITVLAVIIAIYELWFKPRG